MLEISFYKKNEEPPFIVEVSEEIYKWLAKPEFSGIGESVTRKRLIEGEEEELELVDLDKVNRQKLKDFFQNAIIDEVKTMRHELGDTPSTKELQAGKNRLWELVDLLVCVEDENYHFLQRV